MKRRNLMSSEHEYTAQISTIQGDVKRLTTDLSELRTDLYQDTSEAIKQFSKTASEKLIHGGRALKQSSQHGSEIVVTEVKAHPLASILLATGLGLMIGALAMWSQSQTR
jgi:ElaB/YqjD/DUF883 family membrane-anchored ribosome-binding protein